MPAQADSMLTCISPVDGSVYAQRPRLELAQAWEKIQQAQSAQRAWAARPLEQRMQLVARGIELLGEMNDEIVPELAWQMGRPIRYGGEFAGVEQRAGYMGEIASAALADEIVEDSPSFTRSIVREPWGVVFAIVPWNYPYMTAINTIVPALLAGNAVVVKHATQTMLVGERIEQAMHAGGVPKEILQNLVLDHAACSELIAKGAFGFVNFTGSVQAGRTIAAAAANCFAGLGLELGGKDPAYVMHDADVDHAAEALMDGAMFNAGQCCCGIERIYVHESLYEQFVEHSVGIVRRLVLGNPLEQNTTLGPMASARLANAVRAQVSAAIAAGARAHIESMPADDKGAYLSPQVLTEVDHSMELMREENFGPVVGIMKVADDQAAIELMNDSKYGLTASVWTKDADHAATLAVQLETGTVFMNRCDYLDPALCWTGCKDSGRGGSLSAIGFRNLTRPKSLHFKKDLS